MMTQLRTWLAAVAVLSLLLAACPADDPDIDPADPDPDVELDEPVRLAFLGSLSGPFAIWGIHTRNGMRLALLSNTAIFGGLLLLLQNVKG
jgi:hypothetical protein